MTDSDEDRARSTRLGAEDRGRSVTDRVLGSWLIGMSSDVVCGLHRTHGYEEQEFLG
jgi:hypothetical protein